MSQRPPFDRQYERPHQAWVCGQACAGQPCSLGPTPRGECGAAPECQPRRDGEHWLCTRSIALGGKCASGPQADGACRHSAAPCAPRRSLRTLRNLCTFGCSAAALAVLLIGLSRGWWLEFLAPGPLTLPHAQILNRASTSNRCAACHAAGEGAAGDWALDALSGGRRFSTPQAALCLKCHEKGFDAEHALLAHGVAPQRLNPGVSATVENPPPQDSRLFSIPQNERGEIACSTCHQEHHGQTFDLKQLTSQQCQTCHARQFARFSQGHPEFRRWPNERRTPIAFDHVSHQAKHFSAARRDFQCGACHHDDSRREVKLTANFQQACASCHAAKIEQSVSDGWAVFSLPGIEAATLREAGLDVGAWPERLSTSFDGAPPLAMQLLLSADERGRAALNALQGDLGNVDPQKKEQLQAAADLVLAIKKLLHELAAEGDAALERRLTAALGTKADRALAARLCAQLPRDLMSAAEQSWFPPAETPPAQTKEKPVKSCDDDLLAPEPAAKPAAAATPEPANPAAPAMSSGWRRDDARFAIVYQPLGHADPLLKAWLELAVSAPGVENASSAAQWSAAQWRAAQWSQLLKPTALGRCVECHRVDSPPAGERMIHWLTNRRDLGVKEFTRFSHRPHLIQPQLQDCTQCHELNNKSVSSVSQSAAEPRPLPGDFLPLRKAACVQCHLPQAAGDQCLKCHNYHVGRNSR